MRAAPQSKMNASTISGTVHLRPLAVSAAALDRLAGVEARVLAIHQHGMVVATKSPGDDVFVGPPGSGLLPLHVVLRSDDWWGLHRHASRQPKLTPLRLAFDVDGARLFRPRLWHRLIASSAVDAAFQALQRWLHQCGDPCGLGGSVAHALQADGLPACVLRYCAQPPAAPAALRRLIGLGSGSTPAGDDIVVGALAQAWAAGGASAPLVRTLRILTPELERLTTRTSAAYLRAAVSGEFGSHLIALVGGLARGEERCMPRLAQRVARHGATSGIDTLIGLSLMQAVG